MAKAHVSVGKVPVFPGVGVELEWDPVPEVIYRLSKIEAYLENTQLLAETIQPALQYDMATRFNTETDPSGNPWAELVQPAKDQQGILQLTGEMRDTAISDAPWEATPVGVFFDTTVLPEYWAYHDIGSYRIPRGPRKFIGVSAVEGERIVGLGDQWMAQGIEIGIRGFIGVGRAPSGVFTRIH